MTEAAAAPLSDQQVQPIDPLNPPAPKPLQPEDDPNLQMEEMIARRKTRRAPEPAATETKPADAKPAEQTAQEVADAKKTQADTGDLIAKALGFRKKVLPADKEDTKAGPAKEKAADKPADDGKTADNAATDAAKTIVTKKKAAPQVDHARIAAEAATAATREALKSVTPISKLIKDEPPKPEDLFDPVDRHEYEVAKFMSETNPKFKGAERVIAEQVRKANTYADQWEAKNPGKVFDPDDEEHNDFFDAQKKPWTDLEFKKAEHNFLNKDSSKEEIQRVQEPLLEKIKKLEESQAESDVSPIVQQTHIAAAAVIARSIGEDVLNKVSKEGFDKLAESDPVTAEVLAEQVHGILPMIDLMIKIDDPKGRFKFDPKNELHQQWQDYLISKEAEHYGKDDGHGRTLVGRSEFSKMNGAQQSKHWYLNVNHLVNEYVNETASKAVERINSEKERQKKIALSLGYVPREDAGKTSKKTQATNKVEEEIEEEAAAIAKKPASPSSGGGVAIDNKAEAPKHGVSRLSQELKRILTQ